MVFPYPFIIKPERILSMDFSPRSQNIGIGNFDIQESRQERVSPFFMTRTESQHEQARTLTMAQFARPYLYDTIHLNFHINNFVRPSYEFHRDYSKTLDFSGLWSIRNAKLSVIAKQSPLELKPKSDSFASFDPC